MTEFGDYFRTHRWMQGPGADQPGPGKRLDQGEGGQFHRASINARGCGWRAGMAAVGHQFRRAADALFADFVMGYNLLSFHGCYYSTHGGWWKWCRPVTRITCPIGNRWGRFMDCRAFRNISLRQGTHVCDVAVIYPVCPKEAGLDGDIAVKTAFDSGRFLYDHNLDFDFMDFESLYSAEIAGGRLCVLRRDLPGSRSAGDEGDPPRDAGKRPPSSPARAGRSLPASLPEASDRLGFNDPEVDRLNREIFGLSAAEAINLPTTVPNPETGNGRGMVVRSPAVLEAARDLISHAISACATAGRGGYLMHLQTRQA